MIYHGGKILSLNEAGLPYQVGNSLATSGAYSYEEQLKSAMTAHPKIDPMTQEMFFFGVSPVDKPYLHYYVADRNGQIVKHEPITLPAASMMHDFQLTENFVIFIDMPIVFDLGLAIAQQFLSSGSHRMELELVLCRDTEMPVNYVGSISKPVLCFTQSMPMKITTAPLFLRGPA